MATESTSTGQKAPDMFTGAAVPNPPRVTTDGKPSASTGAAGVPMRRVVGWVAPVALLVVGAGLWSVSPWLTLGMLGAALVVAGVVALAPAVAAVAARRATAKSSGRPSKRAHRGFNRRSREARGDRWAVRWRLPGRGPGAKGPGAKSPKGSPGQGSPGRSRWRLPGRGPGAKGPGAKSPKGSPGQGSPGRSRSTRRGWRRVIPWGRPTPSPRSAAGRAAKRKAAERKARREWWFGPTELVVPPQPKAQPRGKRARRRDETTVQPPSDSKPRPQGKAGRRRGRDDGRQDRRTRQQFPESFAEPIVPGSADDAGFPYIPPPDRSSAGSGGPGEMPPAASSARPANYYDVDETGWPLPAPTTPLERQGRNESMTTTSHTGQVDASTIATATATLNEAADAARRDGARLRGEALTLREQGAAMLAKDSRDMQEAGARMLAEAGRREVTAQTRVGMAAAYAEQAAEVAARG